VTRFVRGLVAGALAGGLAGAGATAFVAREPTTKLIVAAMPIDEGSTITVSMLEAREVPSRFMSKRKLGVANVAGVLGQEAPHDLRAGDFLDPTHFSARPDTCALDAKALAGQLGLTSAPVAGFLERLAATEPEAQPGPGAPRR
jgi:hypothetical protein